MKTGKIIATQNRYKVETWSEWREGREVKKQGDSILQVRNLYFSPATGFFGVSKTEWSEWQDVPTEYVEV